MLIVAAYDISITSDGGPRRLSKVAKICSRYGRRVQNSVFECNIDTLAFTKMRAELDAVVDLNRDSLRFYNLGKHYQSKIIHEGTKDVQDIEDPLIL
ncbi:CRISPR-associated endonuclease Cas2 [Secundilactobacillus muriivasis]